MSSLTAPLEGSNGMSIEPLLLYRVADGAASFATWKMETGHEAVALFSSRENAAAYRSELGIRSSEWNELQPKSDALLSILRASVESGILYAVLDPLAGSARTLFDLPRILASQPSN
ncbi:hypothetical protein Psta_3173 [Pirellula staleyi DSM 6068]|uniref:SseB protein N-terminal domain-containing protein n=1 Tax=Pirellula staleyi (strain ATCC 27377 / DSM 6068 / ICPB 4128) TaxID=530564 RepID=D2QWN4_PIRSD|nr:hypothetical protein [Pirellula staleyi]ADB17837.1 hypothetical protein Psta_3173 [Pirellula staleyi DSM 6068]